MQHRNLFTCAIVGLCLSMGPTHVPSNHIATAQTLNSTDLTRPAEQTEDGAVDSGAMAQPSKGITYKPLFYKTDAGETLPIQWAIACGFSATSFRELESRAEVIVIGEPLESIEASEIVPGEGYNAYSITDFKVETALKGSFQAGDTLPYSQSAAILSNRDMSFPEEAGIPIEVTQSSEKYLYLSASENYRPVRKGAKYILFLSQGLGTDTYFPVGMESGRYNVDGTDEINYSLPEQRQIRDYALALYNATRQNPAHNPLVEILALSDQTFAAPLP
jgi:hypothetical protein